jgi:hypothetical protein
MSQPEQHAGDTVPDNGPGRDGDQGPDRAEDQLALVPRRLAEWEEQDGRVVVHRPRPTTRGLAGLRDRFHYMMAPSQIRLDEVGSTIWRGMDGRATIADLATLVPPEPEAASGQERAEDASPLCDSPELAARRVGLFLRVLLDHELATLDGPGEDAPAG